MDSTISVLSLLVAALAVFVGPIITWLVTKQQLRSAAVLSATQVRASLDAANKQIVAPMRQAWINNLRDMLAELLANSLHYYLLSFEIRTEEEYQRIGLLEERVKLMLNPSEDDHIRLQKLVRKLVGGINPSPKSDDEFIKTHQELTELSRTILKREWDRVKDPIPLSSPTDA